MPEARRLWGQLSLLTAAVLALHIWLLAGAPRVQPVRPPLPWSTRNVAPPPVAAPLASVTAPAPAVTNTTARRTQGALRAAAASTSPAAAASQPPGASTETRPISPAPAPPARHHYLVTSHSHGITSRGEAELQWAHDGSQYEAQLAQSAPGLRTRIQRSVGLITAQGLTPLRFSDKSRSEEATHFERESGKLIFSSNRPDAILEAGAQDRLSVILQLGTMIAADASRFRQDTRIAVQTVTTREAQPWVFGVEGVEQLELPGGTVPALKLSREPLGPYDARMELWLAPGADYAPVRLRLTQPNGDWVDQQWSSTDKR